MKKNFNEILQREDYVRLTANLKERTEEIAQLIKSKMVQLDLEDETIEVEGVKVAIKGVSSNCGRYEFLAIENTGEFSSEHGEKDWWSLQDVNHTFYYAGEREAKFQRQAEKAKSDNNMLNYRIGKLQNTVKSLHAEIERRDAANASMKRTIEQLRDEIADLHRKYKVLRIADHIR